jgi:moderate conductance mechanosensitive channel
MENIQQLAIDITRTYWKDIALIVVLFFLGRSLLKLIVRKTLKVVSGGDKEKRITTLGSIIVATGNVVIYVVILLMILKLFGVDIRPILAGAGILGLAVGFGAQSLVKDLVSGLFILIENQYGIGDKVKIGNSEGKVVKITTRSTTLKDDEGKVHYLSNGSINSVINYSQTKY